MSTLDELIAIKQQVEQQYLGRPGVTGVDVGYKVVGGVQTDQLAIRVHVEEKKTRVPAAEKVPAEIDGVVTDVLERAYQLQVVSEPLDVGVQAVDTNHYPTLQGGISMGPSRVIGGSIFAGTLGAIVVDNTNNQHAALTNFHVACVDSSWAVGNRMVQPSRIDTGVVPGDEFGGIVRAVLSGHVDGSVVSIDSGRANSAEVAEIGTVKGTKTATLGMAVRKRGRTTGLTYGSVDGLSLTVNVDYGDGIGVKQLTDQVSIAADTTKNAMFSDHGDSGSVIVDGSGYVVGLLFAGAGAGTVANPIASVLSELNVSMLVGKALLKDFKDGRKDIIKDKELLKERKDLIKEHKEFAKELRKDVIKERVLEGKMLKDIRDIEIPKPGRPGDPGPVEGGRSVDDRLGAIEQQLAALTSFIDQDQRPDLSSSAFSGEAEPGPDELQALRAELENQVTEAAAAKAEFDGPMA
ncbi:chymotrypsin family serine protease [Nakamurella lactea]|uniref:hypothetical protein n=1 Tax=Nakamurella lactea TaxID=459515 RepID=UPI000428AE2E|nr:hypothetical protein [Nakamurella lactea]